MVGLIANHINLKKMTVEQSINRLEFLTSHIPRLLSEIEEANLSLKISPKKWSKKEIIGHLIDSATNNHQRFIRGQFELNPEISYNQDKWNEFNFYNDISGKQIISFWKFYNQQLMEIVKRIPKENLSKEVRIEDKSLTLAFLFIDYVKHLEHHLKQIVEY
ncbi:DinB family protein [Pedobacter sp. ASV28]|uniref:DinB family protein n=1 Tax=Pedobacter sp. ASV28 TaxID=2795123 RepID=UPI001E64A401|nr:DinB family protein [Pedobacter sp. ASV28]